MIALATRFMYLICLFCSTGSPLLMTLPPKPIQSRKALQDSILVVSARMTGKIRTALYLRISTPDQKPDLQYDGLRAYAERAGLQMAELESSLIGERVSAGMKAAAARGKNLGRPPLAPGLVKEIKMLATSTNLGIREIHKKIGRKASRGRVGEITKQTRSATRKLPGPAYTCTAFTL